MPTLKAELVELCNTWEIWLPDIPQNMRVIDLQEALRNYDAMLTVDTMAPEAWTKTWGKKKKPYRYRWPEAVHDEVLARLLDLNQKRYQEEVASGLHEKKKTTKKKTTKKKSTGPTEGALFENEETT